MSVYRIYISCILFLFCISGVAAQPGEVRRDTVSVSVKFKKGITDIDIASFGNSVAMLKLKGVYTDAMTGKATIESAYIKASASPEGVSTRNHSLAALRRDAVLNLLPDVSGFSIDTDDTDIDWPMLASLIAASGFEWKEEALRIISDTPIWVFKGCEIVDSRKRRLMNLRGGKAWNDMAEHFFPDMRYANCTVVLEYPVESAVAGMKSDSSISVCPEESADTLVELSASAHGMAVYEADGSVVPVVDDIGLTNKNRKVSVGLRTNLLYDAVLVPNLGVEVAFARRWAVSADWMYAWWSRNSSHRYWRVYGGEAEVKCSLSDYPSIC